MNSTDKMQSENRSTIVGTTTPDLEIPFESCLIEGAPDPCMVVIVGASGDLTARKIVPALFNLFLNNGLPDPFLVVGCARTKLSNQEFRARMKNVLKTAGMLDESKWVSFARLLHYQPIDYGDLPLLRLWADLSGNWIKNMALELTGFSIWLFHRPCISQPPKY